MKTLNKTKLFYCSAYSQRSTHLDLFKLSKKGLLFYSRRRSRALTSFTAPNIRNDDVTYYKQMKEFIKESEGVPKNSQKWWDLRNKHYQILSKLANEDQSVKIVESQDKSYVRFYFILIPENLECYELINLLNYFNFRYKALEDTPISKSIIKQYLDFNSRHQAKHYGYPFMQFESSEEPTQNVDGFNDILQFLIQNNLMHDYRTHSVYEKEGLILVDEIEEVLKELFAKFTNKFSFYFRITNFTEARYGYSPFKDGYIYRSRIISRLYRLAVDIVKDFSKMISFSSKKYSGVEGKLNELKQTWVERLNNKAFHGGDVPDKADFKLYSLLCMYSKCRKINLNINKESSEILSKFKDWYSKMSLLCTRSSYYNIKDFSYNYSDQIDQELQEQERINKQDKVESDDNLKGAFANRKKRYMSNI